MSIFEQGKIVVTGGTGFIGSAVVWALNERGFDDILVTDFLGKGSDKFKNLVGLRFDDYLEADCFINQLEERSSAFADVSVIFHLGACSSTTERNNRYLIENNYEYTKRLAHWAVERGVRFLYASSAATYGDGKQGMLDEEGSLSDLRPLNMYGYSKHLFDLYAQRHGLLKNIVGLKYFNVFGPNENHKGDMRSLVNKAFYQIKETGRVELFKSYNSHYRDGEQRRDFLYIKDAVAMTLYLAEEEALSGLFNVGSGKANTWIDLVTPIFHAMNKGVNIEFIGMPEQLREKYQYYTRADITKLRASGYIHRVTALEEAVFDYVKNYLLPDVLLTVQG
jgi:ADP-L-glycero-D-manno-heptose 6-epimerase